MVLDLLDNMAETIAETIYDKLSSDGDENYLNWSALESDIKETYMEIATEIIELIREELSEDNTLDELGEAWEVLD
jgi:iron uptake system EfeUOB component EfeO/EfeM